MQNYPEKPLKACRKARLWEGELNTGASQETGPLALLPACVPRGTKELYSCLFPHSCALVEAASCTA